MDAAGRVYDPPHVVKYVCGNIRPAQRGFLSEAGFSGLVGRTDSGDGVTPGSLTRRSK